MAKTVTLEEKLNAQVKNIVAILGSNNPMDAKLMMFEQQKENIDFLLESIAEQLRERY